MIASGRMTCEKMEWSALLIHVGISCDSALWITKMLPWNVCAQALLVRNMSSGWNDGVKWTGKRIKRNEPQISFSEAHCLLWKSPKTFQSWECQIFLVNENKTWGIHPGTFSVEFPWCSLDGQRVLLTLMLLFCLHDWVESDKSCINDGLVIKELNKLCISHWEINGSSSLLLDWVFAQITTKVPVQPIGFIPHFQKSWDGCSWKNCLLLHHNERPFPESIGSIRMQEMVKHWRKQWCSTQSKNAQLCHEMCK